MARLGARAHIAQERNESPACLPSVGLVLALLTFVRVRCVTGARVVLGDTQADDTGVASNSGGLG